MPHPTLSYATPIHWALAHPPPIYATPYIELCHTQHRAMPNPFTELQYTTSTDELCQTPPRSYATLTAELCHTKLSFKNVYYLWLQLRWTSWWRRSSWASSTTPTSSTSSGSASTSIPGKETWRICRKRRLCSFKNWGDWAYRPANRLSCTQSILYLHCCTCTLYWYTLHNAHPPTLLLASVR